MLWALSYSAMADSDAFEITSLAAYASRGSAKPILNVCTLFHSAPMKYSRGPFIGRTRSRAFFVPYIRSSAKIFMSNFNLNV